MKKRLYISSFILIVVLFAGLGINYLLSLHKVSFSLDAEVSGITVYTASDKEIKRLPTNGHILLQEGKYYIVPEGEKIAKDKIEFTVKKEDVSLEVNPPYTSEHLETLLNQEEQAIQAAITAKYPSLIGGYTIGQGELYERGEWFGGLLQPKVDPRDRKSSYRVVLRKEDNVWTVVRRPEYVLTSSRYSDVPGCYLKRR